MFIRLTFRADSCAVTSGRYGVRLMPGAYRGWWYTGDIFTVRRPYNLI